MTDKRVLEKIEELEAQLKDLKLELRTNVDKKSDRLKVGQRVLILNPRMGQDDSRVICRVNYATNRATVKTKKGKVSRIFSNLKRK